MVTARELPMSDLPRASRAMRVSTDRLLLSLAVGFIALMAAGEITLTVHESDLLHLYAGVYKIVGRLATTVLWCAIPPLAGFVVVGYWARAVIKSYSWAESIVVAMPMMMLFAFDRHCETEWLHRTIWLCLALLWPLFSHAFLKHVASGRVRSNWLVENRAPAALATAITATTVFAMMFAVGALWSRLRFQSDLPPIAAGMMLAIACAGTYARRSGRFLSVALWAVCVGAVIVVATRITPADMERLSAAMSC